MAAKKEQAGIKAHIAVISSGPLNKFLSREHQRVVPSDTVEVQCGGKLSCCFVVFGLQAFALHLEGAFESAECVDQTSVALILTPRDALLKLEFGKVNH